MENKQFRLKKIRSQIRRLFPVVFLMFSIFLMVLWQTQNPFVVKARWYIADKMTPVVTFLSIPSRWLKTIKDKVNSAISLYQRNEELEAENKNLRAWRALALQLQSEQEVVKRMAKYVSYSRTQEVTARLVMDTGDKFSRSYIALAGSKNAVSEGNIALTDKGLFARVIEVGDYGCRLMLLTDYSSRVPVLIGKNRIAGVLAGDNTNQPKILFVENPELVAVGDVVLTSGYMGVYPAGLNIGIVNHVTEAEMTVDLFETGENLEFVRLIDFGLSDVLLKSDCKE